MKSVKIVILAMTVILAYNVNKVSAQAGESAVPFLLISPDSKFAAMGDAGSAVSDKVSAIYWNPAGIAFLTGTEASVTHSKWLPQFNLDLFYDYLAFRTYVEDLQGSVTSSLTYMNYGDFIRTDSHGYEMGHFRAFDMALTLGYATKLDNDWGFGLNFRIIRSQLAETATENEKGRGVSTTASFDLGFIWRPQNLVFDNYDMSDKLSVGVNISNIGPKIYYIDKDQADPLPTNFRLGIGVNVYKDEYNSFSLVADINKPLIAVKRNVEDTTKNTRDDFYKAMFTSWGDRPMNQMFRQITFGMGAEYLYSIPGEFSFALRGGYFYEDPQAGGRKYLTFGGGVNYDLYSVDFSYLTTGPFNKGSDTHPLDGTLRFTIGFCMDAIATPTKGFARGI